MSLLMTRALQRAERAHASARVLAAFQLTIDPKRNSAALGRGFWLVAEAALSARLLLSPRSGSDTGLNDACAGGKGGMRKQDGARPARGLKNKSRSCCFCSVASPITRPERRDDESDRPTGVGRPDANRSDGTP